jgi:LPPG:FO 2-phospho-L-lactate transferase
MLAVAELRQALQGRGVRAVAVSPIIGGKAVKGPAAKILQELGQEVSPVSIARYYQGLIDILLIDGQDAHHAEAVSAYGIEPVVAPILMQSLEDRRRLAQTCLAVLAKP